MVKGGLHPVCETGIKVPYWRWYDKLDTKLREKGDSVYG